MFQYGLVAKIAERAAENGRVLLDDAGERDDKDHPAQLVMDGMVQGECQRGQCLAATGRDGEGEQPCIGLRLSTHVAQDSGAYPIHTSLCRNGLEVIIQPHPQFL